MIKIEGTITALVTPFFNGEVDEESLVQLLQHQLKNKIDGFVVNGTTAESPTLESAEIEKIFKIVKANCPSHMPIIVGTGSNSTKKTIEDTIKAKKMGAHAALVVVPYYNNPPQRGLLKHFLSVAESSDFPIILYNVPGRTVAKLELDTIVELSKHKNIIGIKEATGNIEFAKQIRSKCGEDFILLSGDDGTYDAFFQAGGNGVISVSSHIIPLAMKERNIKQNAELIQALFCEANPIPVKRALYEMKIIKSPELRLPLVEMGPENSEKLKSIMNSSGLL
jgi:4-hydroxy-tetrahydrodipicolinate synthase